MYFRFRLELLFYYYKEWVGPALFSDTKPDQI